MTGPSAHTWRRRGWALLGGLVLVATGCSGGAQPAAAPEPEWPQTTVDLAVTATEFSFDHDRWAIPAGQEITLSFINGGTIPHGWAILRNGTTVHSGTELRQEMVLFEVEAITEGTVTSQIFTINVAGTYQVVDMLGGQFDAGMSGELLVAPAAPL